MKKVELLAPAGSLDKAKIALMYGADAVYVGGKQFSLRARASNFELEDLKELSEFAHERNKKVYVTMNIIPHDEDLQGLDEYLKYLESIKIDAIITSSRYIMSRALEVAPNVERHLSTQMSTTNSLSIDYYKKIGVERVVLAREVTLCEIEKIMKKQGSGYGIRNIAERLELYYGKDNSIEIEVVNNQYTCFIISIRDEL